MVADVQITGPAIQYFLYALVIPVGFFFRLVIRTSPRSQVLHLSKFEMVIAPWLWSREHSTRTVALATVTALGAVICTLTYFLPVVTFTERPLFAGDPFAEPMEHAPSAGALGLALGIVLALLALRRAVGGEGVTVPIALILATLLALVAALALADYLSNDSGVTSRFAPVVTAGPGLIVLFIGSAVAWIGCAADLITGVRRSARLVQQPVRPVVD